jgi:N-acetylglutamate synthase-like GNAT family acetyltransferase
LPYEIDYLARHEHHLPLIAEWQLAEFGYLNPADTLEGRMTRLGNALQTSALPMAFVARSEEGELLGAASILASTVTYKHLSPWLSSVFVPSVFRGHGIASALSLRAVEEARRLGFDTLYLFTPRNESLYARLGWRTMDVTTHKDTRLTIMSRPTS